MFGTQDDDDQMSSGGSPATPYGGAPWGQGMDQPPQYGNTPARRFGSPMQSPGVGGTFGGVPAGSGSYMGGLSGGPAVGGGQDQTNQQLQGQMNQIGALQSPGMDPTQLPQSPANNPMQPQQATGQRQALMARLRGAMGRPGMMGQPPMQGQMNQQQQMQGQMGGQQPGIISSLARAGIGGMFGGR